MTDDKSITLSCDRHPNDVAHVLCRFHRTLLCISCGLEEANAPECSIVEIRKLSTERDRLLIENLVVKQLAVGKKQLIERHDAYLESLKSNLEQQVLDEHFKLVTRLDKLKDDCMKSIKVQTEVIKNTNKEIKQKLIVIEKTADQNINNLSSISTVDINNIKLRMEEVQSDLMNHVVNRDSRPEGNFNPNILLCNAVLQEDTSLGHVRIIDDDDCKSNERYLKMNTDEKTQSKQLQKNDIKKSQRSISYKRPPIGVQLSSDEDHHEPEDDYLMPIPDSSNTTCYLRNDVKGKDDIASKHRSEHVSNTKQKDCSVLKGRKANSFSGFRELLSSVDKHQKRERGDIKHDTHCTNRGSKESIYHDIEFDPSNSITAEYFMNKTVTISVIRPHFRSACKFCKLVYIGGSIIGLLSKEHNSIVIVSLDGNVLSKKTMISGLVNIASAGTEKFALLIENGRQDYIVNVYSVGSSSTDSFLVKERFEKITGFDFDVTSSLFAISSPNKLVLLDKTGLVKASHTYNSTTTTSTISSEIVSVYDFRKSCLYLSNIQNKTLKCIDVIKGVALWKNKYNDSSFIPRSMCLHNDTICIACTDVIVQLCAEDGTLFMRHETESILEDCLGVCVIDDVIVFTSNSNDFEKSTKLAYKKLS